MKQLFPVVSLFVLLACGKSDLTRTNSLVGKWRLYETNLYPGYGVGPWRDVRQSEAEVIEFRSDSTFHVIEDPQENSSFRAASGRRFYVQQNRLDLEDLSRPNTGMYINIGFKVQKGKLDLTFSCQEYCGKRYIAIQ